MPLNESVAAILEQMSSQGGPALHELTPNEVRAALGGMKDLYPAGPEMERVEKASITVDGGEIEARVFVPVTSPRGVIVFYHGGGWMLGGDLDEFETISRKIAARTGCAVVLPNYRLAPEHPFPTAIDDAYAALEWAHEHTVDIAGRTVPLAIVGDSSGGNLATVVTHRARDRKGPPIAFQVLVYPVTDADVDSPSYVAAENQLLVSRDVMIWFWDNYLADSERRLEPDASPLRSKDFAGLPPALVIRGEYDVLSDQVDAYADRLAEAGVAVERRVHPGQIHGFFATLILPGHEEALEQIAIALEPHLPR